jgi:hypothetical protein
MLTQSRDNLILNIMLFVEQSAIQMVSESFD